jgi:hypothetical protein
MDQENDIVTRWLLTRRIISGFWIFMLGLLDIHQAEFTIAYYSRNLTVITLH